MLKTALLIVSLARAFKNAGSTPAVASMKLYKNRKYKGDRFCEAVIGIDPNSRQPHLIKCNKPVVWVYFAKGDHLGCLLCQECFDRINDAAVPE